MQAAEFNVLGQYEDGLNLYQYVCSHPTIAVDPMGRIAKCPKEAPKNNPEFCDDTLDMLHWPAQCWREVVPWGGGKHGNQCCYKKEWDMDDMEYIWIFDHQSPDNSGPACALLGGHKCKYCKCNMCWHMWDDLLGMNPYPKPWPDEP